MYTSNTTYTTTIDAFLLPYAKSLIQYANTDTVFAESMAAILQQLPLIKKTTVNIDDQSAKFISLTDQTRAVATATWLYGQLTNSPTRTLNTTAILQNWASDFESPKDQIFGIVGIAIIGPTLGLISKKKKEKSRLQIVIDKEWHDKLSVKEFSELILETSQRLIAHELRLVGGNVYNLHPDTAAWCLEEPLTSIYLTESSELETIESTAKTENVSFEKYTEGEKLRVLTISPAVNDSFVNEFEVTDLK